MKGRSPRPKVYRIFQRDATSLRTGPTGDVGNLFRGSRFEVVWVSKKGESIDRRWFSVPTVDLLLVIRGRLRVDFQDPQLRSLILTPGDFFQLPPRLKCRAYRWPRTSRQATVFVAIYPVRPGPLGGHRSRA